MKYKRHLLNLEARIKAWEQANKSNPGAYVRPGSQKK